MIKGLKQRKTSAPTKEAIEKLPKAIETILKPPLPLPVFDNKEESKDVQDEGVKIIIPLYIIDIIT